MSIFKKLFGGQTNESSEETQPEKQSYGSLGNIILNFQHSIQKVIEWNELRDVEFAMWLPCDQDQRFASSPMIDKWTVVYSLTKHYWSYIAADVLKTLKLIDQKTFRIALPDNFQSLAFLTIHGEQIIISLSREKGIRFHFAETTPFRYRMMF